MFQFLTLCCTGARRKPTVSNKNAIPETGVCEKRSDAIVDCYEPYLDDPDETVEIIDPYGALDPCSKLYRKSSTNVQDAVDPYAELYVRRQPSPITIDPYMKLGCLVDELDDTESVDANPYVPLDLRPFTPHRSDIDGTRHFFDISANPDTPCPHCLEQSKLVDGIFDILQQDYGYRPNLRDTVLGLQDRHSEPVAGPFRVALENLLQADLIPGGIVGDAYRQVMSEVAGMAEFADDFAHEPPVLTGVLSTVVALGIMEFVYGDLLSDLGFELGGPAWGSWAAQWQSTYGWKVPARSLFAFIQRLAMTKKGL